MGEKAFGIHSRRISQVGGDHWVRMPMDCFVSLQPRIGRQRHPEAWYSIYRKLFLSQVTVFALFPGLILDKDCKSLFIFDKILINGLFTKFKPSAFIKIHQLKIIHT